MNWRRLLIRKWLIGLFLLVGLGIYLFLVLARGAKSTLTEQLLKRRLTVARAEASNLTSYFQQFGDSIKVFAHLCSIERRDASTVQDMDTFVEQRRESGLIGGIVLTDKNGIVSFNSNVSGTRDIGIDLSDRDYFVWAKDQSEDGEYFVGQPVVSRLGATKGEIVVPVVASVYQDSVFTGVVVAAVKLQPLTERFLGMLKISDTTDVYLIDHEGDLLYNSSKPDVVGTNIFELSQDKSFTGSSMSDNLIKNILSKIKEGNFDTGEYLIAYSPVVLGSQNWMLVITSPSQQVKDLAIPIYVRQISILIFAFLTFSLFGVVVANEIKFKRD